MKAYQYSKNTGEYICEVERQLDPLESKKQNKSIYLIPAGTTDIKPPQVNGKQVAVFDGQQWSIRLDHRGKYYHKESKELLSIIDIDVIPDSDYTHLEPTGPFDIWDGAKWIEDTVAKVDNEERVAIEERIQTQIRLYTIKTMRANGDLTEAEEAKVTRWEKS